MVKVEDHNTDDSSDDVVLHKNVGSSSSKPSSGSVLLREAEGHDGDGPSDDFLYRNVGSSSSIPTSIPAPVKEENFSSSSSGHLKSYFVGMGFSSVLVDKVIEEKGVDDENLLLEALINYSDILSSAGFLPSNAEKYPLGDIVNIVKKAVGATPEMVCKKGSVRELQICFNKDFKKSSPESSDSWEGFSSFEKKEENLPDEFISDSKPKIEELSGPSNAELEKIPYLLMMDFSQEEIDLAIKILGVNASLPELVDYIVTAQTAGSSRDKNIGTIDLDSGEDEDLWDDATDNIGQTQNRLGPLDHATEGLSRHSHPATDAWITNASCSNDGWITKSPSSNDGWITKASSSSAAPFDYEDVKAVKKAKHMSMDDNTASCSNHMQRARQDDREPAFETKPDQYHEPQKSRLVKEEMPYLRMPNSRSNVNGLLARPPYFFYGNVVDVSQGTWRKLSQFLYAIEPEFANSQFFSALIRKEGYLHNLPSDGRFHIVPKPPMTIEDALPRTKKWWPSWDTRKQLSCISSEATGVVQICDRLGKMMMESQGFLSKEQQTDIIHQCKRLNLIWVGHNKLRPIEPDNVETILGYPREHTVIWGLQPTDRLAALKYCFQTDTIGYHLAVLKNMYPDGLRVLSVFSGIGGVEIALHRLGIRLKCVVSVEASEINRKILKRWWQNTGQTGALKQIGGIERLTSQTLASFMNQFGGFDIIAGSNPGEFNRASGGDGSADMDFNLFFEFVRVFQRVRSIMGRNS